MKNTLHKGYEPERKQCCNTEVHAFTQTNALICSTGSVHSTHGQTEADRRQWTQQLQMEHLKLSAPHRLFQVNNYKKKESYQLICMLLSHADTFSNADSTHKLWSKQAQFYLKNKKTCTIFHSRLKTAAVTGRLILNSLSAIKSCMDHTSNLHQQLESLDAPTRIPSPTRSLSLQLNRSKKVSSNTQSPSAGDSHITSGATPLKWLDKKSHVDSSFFLLL